MSDPLASWERPHFVAGGGEPFLIYVLYGDIDTDAALSRSRYRSNGIADGLEPAKYSRENFPGVFEGFESGFLWGRLKIKNPVLAAAVTTSPECLVLRGNPRDDISLDYLRDAVGLLTFFLDHGGIGIFDPQTFQWWTPADWRARIFDPAATSPKNHVMILHSQDDRPDTKWFHTRGMRKFGRPDISVRHVPPAHENGVIDLCNRLIELQALGAIVAEGREIKMASLPPGGTARHGGDLDDPDFNNTHIEIVWPNGL